MGLSTFGGFNVFLTSSSLLIGMVQLGTGKTENFIRWTTAVLTYVKLPALFEKYFTAVPPAVAAVANAAPLVHQVPTHPHHVINPVLVFMYLLLFLLNPLFSHFWEKLAK